MQKLVDFLNGDLMAVFSWSVPSRHEMAEQQGVGILSIGVSLLDGTIHFRVPDRLILSADWIANLHRFDTDSCSIFDVFCP